MGEYIIKKLKAFIIKQNYLILNELFNKTKYIKKIKIKIDRKSKN